MIYLLFKIINPYTRIDVSDIKDEIEKSTNVASTEVLFLSNLYRKVVSAIILASMGSVLVHYFDDTVLLYFSVAVWMSSPDGTSVPMYQSYFFLSKIYRNIVWP